MKSNMIKEGNVCKFLVNSWILEREGTETGGCDSEAE